MMRFLPLLITQASLSATGVLEIILASPATSPRPASIVDIFAQVSIDLLAEASVLGPTATAERFPAQILRPSSPILFIRWGGWSGRRVLRLLVP